MEKPPLGCNVLRCIECGTVWDEADGYRECPTCYPPPKKASAFDTQVGGKYYKSYAIQPYEFFWKNKITHEKAAIIRRILRYDAPDGKGLEDLQKIIHECQLLIELNGYEPMPDKADNLGFDKVWQKEPPVLKDGESIESFGISTPWHSNKIVVYGDEVLRDDIYNWLTEEK